MTIIISFANEGKESAPSPSSTCLNHQGIVCLYTHTQLFVNIRHCEDLICFNNVFRTEVNLELPTGETK